MDKVTLELIYTEDEVVFAQRMRFLHSRRLLLMAVIGIIGTAFLAIPNINLGGAPSGATAAWYVPIEVAAIFVGVIGLAYFLAPVVDFRNNAAWRSRFQLTLSDDGFYLVAAGQVGGAGLEWRQVNRILENDKAFVLQYGGEREAFFILPKRILESGGRLEFVSRNLVQ